MRHLLFWLLIFFYFTLPTVFRGADFISVALYNLIFLVVDMAETYILLYLIMTPMIKKKKYFLFLAALPLYYLLAKVVNVTYLFLVHSYIYSVTTGDALSFLYNNFFSGDIIIFIIFGSAMIFKLLSIYIRIRETVKNTDGKNIIIDIPPDYTAIQEPDYLFIKGNRKIEKIRYDDILFIEAMREYSSLVTPSRKIVVKQTLSCLKKQLPMENFVRAHKSYIISLDKIDSFSPASVEIGKHVLPVGRSYKNGLMNAIGYNTQIIA